MTTSNIVIREIEALNELQAVPAVEKEVWGLHDQDVMPMTLIIATKEAGSLWLGAYEGERLIGFAFAFLGIEDGKFMVHSHMLAVLPGYRDTNIGFRLKLAQREYSLARGLETMTWTFDPLQSKNAHLNFGKLGVISTRYKPDFYGAETSSVLHRNSTDRLWVRWPLATKRVNDRVHGRGKDISAEHIELLVRSDQRIRPELMPREQALRRELVGIEIPDDINSLQNNDRELAGKWRTATRGAFTDALKAGFIVAEFIRPAHGVGKAGTYILKKTTPENLYG